jgi:HSP20 family molecular chaperone IbpA
MHPNIKWAQRKANVVLTVDVPDVENHKIDLDPEGNLEFQ